MPGTAITDSEGRELTDSEGRALEESCANECPACGPCSLYIRLLPCNATIACFGGQAPPGVPIWICNTALCLDGRDPSGGLPRPTVLFDRGEGEGVECFVWDGTPAVSEDNIPQGEIVVSASVVQCGPPCGTDPCGIALTGWAKAIKCHPSAPDLYFCRGDFPYCVTTSISSNWLTTAPGRPGPACPIGPFNGHCYKFSPFFTPLPDLPPGACVARPPAGFDYVNAARRTCCQCQAGCIQTVRTIARTCGLAAGPDFVLTCCCGNLTNAYVVYGGRNVYDTYSLNLNFEPFRQSHTEEDWGGDSRTASVFTRRTQFFNEDGSLQGPVQVYTEPIPAFAPTCPMLNFPRYDFVVCASPCPGGGGWEMPLENRTCTTWSISGAYNCGAVPFMNPGSVLTSNAFARLVGMTPQTGCSDGKCNNAQPLPPVNPLPPGFSDAPAPGGGFAFAQGSENGGIRVRGGGSRVVGVDGSEVVGCGSCGDGLGW